MTAIATREAAHAVGMRSGLKIAGILGQWWGPQPSNVVAVSKGSIVWSAISECLVSGSWQQ
eukprot:11926527-Karenia_brevis.AAC.1